MKSSPITRIFLSLKGIILFLLISMSVIGVWKLLNIDAHLFPYITGFTDLLGRIEITLAYWIMKPVFWGCISLDGDTIYHTNQSAITMMVGCNGLKQMIQWNLIMILYPGFWNKKLWYLPLSTLILFVASILHFIFLAVVVFLQPDWFDYAHSHVSRWFFFAIFFFLWVYWEEKIAVKKKN